MSSETNSPLPHNQNQLGQALRSPKKRSAIFIVVVVSVGVHVLGLGIFGVIKIVETISPPPEFEAPPVVEVAPPPPPPPPPPTTKRSQKSLPRPQPLAAQNPQNMSVPAISMQESDLSFGRGMGGGLGELGGGIMDRVDISFFGIEGGNNVVVLFDRTGSGMGIFNRTRQELMKTINSMTENPGARLAVLYFGGKEGGHQGISRGGSDPTRHDYWWPKGVRKDNWLQPARGDAEGLLADLKAIPTPGKNSKSLVTKGAKDVQRGKAYFVLGTNFFGALEAAYKLKPAPDTVYLMVEPDVAFTSLDVVNKAHAAWKKYGVPKPENTKVIFVVGKPAKQVRSRGALNLMVKLLNGGDLSPQKINELIVF
ncbi:hypothetical protein SH580_05515 [Coraliomargarita algicola]|uniref:VWFA domain-containing protein n=1 Tax=Coraliomargarita algicola TaxID=3092156 RepID=A0ABZ0RQB3_9BACT|nr:hypothetical protein [Coraliomargarita sp. J2-16]WPJ97165.1 hypothetical protein SH580_05515 [Coraliomargarita sp. J2-16]